MVWYARMIAIPTARRGGVGLPGNTRSAKRLQCSLAGPIPRWAPAAVGALRDA